ncbi:hypothetical protein BKA62DRAFT_830889 [Auriculariales sp. MPI-PUGE-AT-0066]|nr:hypothetical protein BKA62DRAFT_830889 [Auriculariales sp. MPI-PUGE-AT-0066]
MLSQNSVHAPSLLATARASAIVRDIFALSTIPLKDVSVVQAITVALRRANRATHLHLTMPIELLAEIFKHLPISDRFKATAVCQHWREIAFTCPDVWADLSDFGPATSMLEAALTRSRTAPVDLAVVFRSPDSHRHLNLLRKHLHHIRTLEVEIAEPWLNEFSDIVVVKAPVLQHVSIGIHGLYGGIGPRLREDIFGGMAPNLRYLALSHVSPPTGEALGLITVENLSITLQFARPEECTSLHASMPHVREYVLRLMSHPLRAEADASHIDTPSLRVLRLPRSLGTLIPALPHNSAERVSMQQTDADAFRRVANGMDTPPTHMVLLKNSTRAGFVMAACCTDDMDVDRRERFAHAVACRSPLEFFTPHIEANLRSFATGASLWRDVRTTIELPALRMLALVLPVHDDDGGLKTPAEHLPMCFTTPKLQVVRIAARPTRNLILAEEWAEHEPAAFIAALGAVQSVTVEVAGSPAAVAQFKRHGIDVVACPSMFSFGKSPDAAEDALARDESISRVMHSIRVPASAASTPLAYVSEVER